LRHAASALVGKTTVLASWIRRTRTLAALAHPWQVAGWAAAHATIERALAPAEPEGSDGAFSWTYHTDGSITAAPVVAP
jgi:hypothetical protein